MSGSVRVLIVTRDDRLAAPLATGLDALGWRTLTARGVNSAVVALEDFPIEAVVVVDAAPADAVEIAGRLRGSRAPRALPVVALLDAQSPGEANAFDLRLSPACHPVQLALRLEQLLRAVAAEEEFDLRRITFHEHGHRTPAPEANPAPLSVLTVGEPAPKFLALSHALRTHGAGVTGAFTAYTAFDYLHERAFDAVVLWGGEGQTEALSIAAGMRRNSRLFHLPTVLYLRSRAEIDVAHAYRRGVTDIATADTPERDTAARTVALAQAYRRERAIRGALDRARGAGLVDVATGLFTNSVFASHLARLSEVAADRRKPLSLVVLRVADTPDVLRARPGAWLDKALPQVGSMIARLVRAEDTAAQIAPEVFALALPGGGYAAARSAAERIAAVVACTAFPVGEGQRPFTLDFEIGVAEVEAGETAGAALERAAAALEFRKAS